MRYDLALFEQLNDEYRDRPIYPQRVRQEPSAETPEQAEAARVERELAAAGKRLTAILKDVDLTGEIVVELGCGEGWLTSILPERAGAAKAIGVDARPFPRWEQRTDPRVFFVASDLAEERTFPPRSIDVAIFQGLLSRPVPVLSALFDALKDGGAVWLRLNLFAARNASFTSCNTGSTTSRPSRLMISKSSVSASSTSRTSEPPTWPDNIHQTLWLTAW